ncbi:MAG: hypothetical protein Unbinned1502contig1001_39 [Prokaryotic dsDNA virus sp.]|nr:MAG: hypothetical protein Unbinned1502contig1001_39 [Prokaryotic dsDNA virus sp.]|tara:strand:- start:4434 stop:4628 length:195 start_codon:yes stop_codon:yes gene_type:complete
MRSISVPIQVYESAVTLLIYTNTRATMLYGCLYELVSLFTAYTYIYGFAGRVRPGTLFTRLYGM